MFRRVGQRQAFKGVGDHDRRRARRRHRAAHQFGVLIGVAAEHLPQRGDVAGDAEFDPLNLDLARLFVAFNAHDIDAIMGFFADSAVFDAESNRGYGRGLLAFTRYHAQRGRPLYMICIMK